jgi:hypothetical protein
MRAKLTGAMLASDMSAFKAANPGAVFEDVVRWLSPRDWLADNGGGGGGRLSARMSNQVSRARSLALLTACCWSSRPLAAPG